MFHYIAVIDGQQASILLSIGKSIDEMLFNKTLDLIDSHRLEIGVKWAHIQHIECW